MGSVSANTDLGRRHVRVLHLRNRTCIYCGLQLTADTTTTEHVIGRRFVPKGSMHANWNLLACCCGPCNNRKAALEDDISAILLQPNGFGDLVADDPQLADEAQRKGKATHRGTGKKVKDSRCEFDARLRLNSDVMSTMGFVGPPQLDPQRVRDLALHHVTAFIYLTTFNSTTQLGQFARGKFAIFNQALQRDWGNVVQREFARATASWQIAFGVRTANGHFKAMLRKHPTAPCRSFALEWNMNLRIVGMIGDDIATEEFAAALPEHTYNSLGANMRFREEIALAPADDLLFQWVNPSAATDSAPG